MTVAAAIKSDSQIKADVLGEMQWDPIVNETDVGVLVHNGIVTLTGTVSAYAKKLAARDAAHRVFGVRDVVDDMKVKVPAVWERTDEDLARAVRHALQWDVLVPDQQIKSTVSNGVVTLEGTVTNWVDASAAVKAVQSLTGTKGVLNRISIAPKQVDAARIKGDIEKALSRQTEREARRINVAVRDGVVTLTGCVRSWGEKNAIERAAYYADGVSRIDDRTTVDPYQ